MIISVAGLLALGGLATIAGTIGSGSLSLTKATTAHADHNKDAMVEKAFRTPTTTGEGYKPYYLCSECCANDANTSRYSLTDKSVNVTDVVIPALTAATTSDIASGDEIANVNLEKFKYVDQGANGVDGKEGTSTPWYIKDSGKTAIYFSRSGKTGAHDGKNVEFRFTAASSSIKSVTFSYRLNNWGTGTATDSVEYTSLCQFISNNSGSNRYESLALDGKIQNDDAWHTVTINYSDYDSSASVRTEFTGFLLKFADLRGYVMISGLSYDYVTTLTLKNATVDGTDKTETVSIGSLPANPTMDGKKFLGWYDESGNKVTSVDNSTSTLIARWGIAGDGSDGLDYMAQLSEKTAALPDSVTDDNKTAAVAAYKEYADAYSVALANMTAYEKANYVESSKVSSIKTSLAGETTEVLSIPSVGNGWETAHALGIYSDANFGVNFTPRDIDQSQIKYKTNYIGIDLQNGGYKETKTYYIDLPKINYSAYSSVSFYMYSPSYDDTTKYNIKADGNEWVNNVWFPNEAWPSVVTISTVNGVTTIESNYFNTKETATLSDEVAKGAKALRFERYREVSDSTKIGYDSFCFSTLVATI